MKKLLLTLLISFCLIQTVIASEISCDKSNFVPVYTVIDDAAFDIRYYSSNNFTGNRIDGYKAPIAYMTKEGVKALSKAAELLFTIGAFRISSSVFSPGAFS